MGTSGRSHRRSAQSRRSITTRAKLLLLTCAITFAIGTPAFALNRQPLPPGYKSHVNTPATTTTTQANGFHSRGEHFPK